MIVSGVATLGIGGTGGLGSEIGGKFGGRGRGGSGTRTMRGLRLVDQGI